MTAPAATLFTPERLAAAIDYPTYAAQVDSLVALGKTSGPVQNDYLANYTRLNQARMRRIHTHVELLPELQAAIIALATPQTWLVLTEAWCGDAAQNIPILARLAALNPNIKLRMLYRDEHLELMDAYLTNGGRSIPKMIVLRDSDHTVLGTWGPRPAAAQAIMDAWKQDPRGRTKEDVIQDVVAWYVQDKGQSLQRELLQLLAAWH